MVSDIAISFAILGLVVVAVHLEPDPGRASSRSAPRSRSTSPASSTLNQALAGFGDPAVIFIATLFVVSEGLDATRRHGLGRPGARSARVGDSRTRLLVLMMLLVAGLTALISVNGAVAALLPVVVVIAVRLGRSPSQLLIPLVFAAHAGSMLALTGTPGERDRLPRPPSTTAARAFGFFEFGLVGVPLVVGTIADRRAPRRAAAARRARPRGIPSDFSHHAQTLVDAVPARRARRRR